MVLEDTTTFAEFGYKLETYQLDPAAAEQYQTLFETPPSFYIYQPLSIAPQEEVPMIAWFHGGSADNDEGIETPTGNCSAEAIDTMTSQILSNPSPMAAYIASERWSVFLPRNEWCDLWMGNGPEDEVDPVNHFGYVHARRSLDFVTKGGAGFIPSKLYGWGTSAGGGSALSVAARYGGFDGLIMDSSPCVQSLIYNSQSFVYEHIFGGTPDDLAVKARADLADCQQIIATASVDFPIYMPYNTQDTLVSAQHPSLVRDALDQVYGGAGLRYGYHDFNHKAPTPQYHVQSRVGVLPMGYTAGAMMEFLKGSNLIWVEAEDEDGTCGSIACEGRVFEGTTSADMFSLGRGLASTTSGIMYSENVPSGLVMGKENMVIIVMKVPATGTLPDDQLLASIVYSEGANTSELSVTVGDVVTTESSGEGETDDVTKFVPQYLATRLKFTPTVANGVLTVRSTGYSEVDLDAFVYVVPGE
jgi:hypothetical protein